MKKVFSLLAAITVAVCLNVSVLAAEPKGVQTRTVSVETLENGITIVDTVTVNSVVQRSGIGAQRTVDCYNGNVRVGSVTLNANFTYDGITAHATNASSSHWVASGWSYSGESVYTSGATAYLSATISGSTTIPVDITLTCDPYGNIY